MSEKGSLKEEFVFKNEDHTIGHLLQSELLNDKEVIFAGYILPDPLERIIKLRIETREIDPKVALTNAIKRLTLKLDNLEELFSKNC